MGKRAACAGAFLLTLLAGGPLSAGCAEDIVEIRTANGAETFSVEIADTPSERARGLMFREEMPADHGMLFIFDDVAQRAFWMRNTPLPLDIIYINRRGAICSIAANTTPFDETAIPSGCAAGHVLEVNAGLAASLGLKVGAPVRHPSIKDAMWRCE